MHEVLVNHLGGLSLPRKSVVRLTDRPDMTLDVYRGRKTTNQQINNNLKLWKIIPVTPSDQKHCRIYRTVTAVTIIDYGTWVHHHVFLLFLQREINFVTSFLLSLYDIAVLK